MKMPEEKIDLMLFAPCGMNCLVCYKHCYHKKPCGGCRNSDKGKPEHCRKCRIKDCIGDKGLVYCYECPEHPCRLIKNLEKIYKKRYQVSLVENSELVGLVQSLVLTVDEIIDGYLKHITDVKPITARQCIKLLPMIAKDKPELRNDICSALERAAGRQSMQTGIGTRFQQALQLQREERSRKLLL